MSRTGLEELVRLLRRARRVFVFSGAGVSTASNIPDFRGPQGVYRTSSPVYYQEFVADEAQRKEYWEFKLASYRAFADAKPNAAHESLVELERLGRLSLLVTQNVDGLHQAAGTTRERLIELHGTNAEVECDVCGVREAPERCMSAFEANREPPTCLECGGLMKPAVVMFGQTLDMALLARAERAAKSADLVLSLGSSLVVTPAADLPLVGARAGAPYVVVNQGSTPHDALATLLIAADVGEIMSQALAALKATRSVTV
jgi:NAD-dependent deacetylase